MPQVGTRKRPAPGASPMQAPQSQDLAALNHNGSTTTTMAEPYVQWQQQSAVSYPDLANNFGSNLYNGAQDPPPTTLNQLARRSMGQQIVPRGNYDAATSETWPRIPDNAMQPPVDDWMSEDNDLTRRAEVAKKETQSKRKQIPPFVQKLSR